MHKRENYGGFANNLCPIMNGLLLNNERDKEGFIFTEVLTLRVYSPTVLVLAV